MGAYRDRGRFSGLDRAILAIALPAILTNVATALIGIADIWVIGQSGSAAPQAGVEIGSKLFLFIVTIFNFLSFGTTALTAQAAGRGDTDGQAAVLARSLAVALAIGASALIIAFSGLRPAITALGGTGAVADNALAYASVRALAVPAALASMALQGCLIGRRRLRTVLGIEIAFNLLHVGIAIGLVLGAGMGARGAGYASLAAEIAKLLLCAAVVRREPLGQRLVTALTDAATWRGEPLLALFALNRDLFLRTLLLLLAILIFTRIGAGQGTVILAANAVLFQLFLLTNKILDGFETAAQVLGGEAAGRGDGAGFAQLTRRLLGWMFATALLLSALLFVGSGAITAQFTRVPTVRSALHEYHLWLVLLPPLCAASFVFDGLFIAASWTRSMLVSMAGSFTLYALALWLLRPLGNHGLWLAFALLFVFRAGLQGLLLPGLMRRQFSRPGATIG